MLMVKISFSELARKKSKINEEDGVRGGRVDK